jgi:hypothetical protein
MADRSSISPDDYTEATIEDAQVAVKGNSQTISPRTAKQLSSSGKVAQDNRIAKPREALEKAMRDAFVTPKAEKK